MFKEISCQFCLSIECMFSSSLPSAAEFRSVCREVHFFIIEEAFLYDMSFLVAERHQSFMKYRSGVHIVRLLLAVFAIANEIRAVCAFVVRRLLSQLQLAQDRRRGLLRRVRPRAMCSTLGLHT